MDFSEVIGQEEVKKHLIRMAEEERVPHALLFCGTYGSGKMALAMAFASYLLVCSSVAPENAKAMLAKWEHPDLHFSYPTIKLPSMSSDHQPTSSDFAKEWKNLISEGTYFTPKKWMEEMGATTQQAIITGAESDDLAKKLSLKSAQGGYKVVVVWLPERMNLTAANKLLKILEEPTEKTVFLMVSEEPEKLLETIRSRTQRIDLKQIATSDIENALIIRRGIEPDTARRIARLAHGNWKKAMELISADNENAELLQMFQQLMRLAYARDLKGLKGWCEQVADYGREKQRRMLSYFQQQIRENFVYNFQEPELSYMTTEEEDFAKRFSSFINETNVIEISELFDRCYKEIGQNANAKIVFYDMALQIIVLLLRR